MSVAAARALARARSVRGRCLVTPNGAVTVAPLARSAAACVGVATIANLPFARGVTASDMSKPARCSALGLMWLTRYWFSGCGWAASALAGTASASRAATTKSVLRKVFLPRNVDREWRLAVTHATEGRNQAMVDRVPRVRLETVLYDAADGIATISLNQPDSRNALSDELLGDLLTAFEAARGDDDGALRRAHLDARDDLQRGGNLSGFAADVPLVHKYLYGIEKFPRLFRTIGTLGKPVICAANGHCLAGALGLALACDLIIASERATFGTPEINVGVFPFMIMALIYRNVPRKKTTELLLLGERIDAREAERIGIVNRVVAPDEFEAAVSDWAHKLAAKSPVLMRMGKDADLSPDGHGVRGRARLPALAADDRVLDRGHPGGRQGVLREARPGVDGAMRSRASSRCCAAPPTAARRGPRARRRWPRRSPSAWGSSRASWARRASRARERGTRTCATPVGASWRPAVRSTTR